MTEKRRTFRVTGDSSRVLVLPRGVIAGPGGINARFSGGMTFELLASQVDRFIRGRVRAGDLEEIAAAAPSEGADR